MKSDTSVLRYLVGFPGFLSTFLVHPGLASRYKGLSKKLTGRQAGKADQVGNLGVSNQAGFSFTYSFCCSTER